MALGKVLARWVEFRWIRAGAVVALMVVAPAAAEAVTAPFTETFPTDNAGWLDGSSAAALWQATGGVDNGPFISAQATPSAGGFGVALFRGNSASDASGDAFVGDWLTAGVTEFSTFIRHDAPEPLNVFLRLDVGGGAGASSVNVTVPANEWTRLSVPIVDSNPPFQSYGAGTFSGVFSNMQNVQVFLSSTQPSGVLGNSYTFGLDSVSVVPEPSGVVMALAAAGCAAGLMVRRRAGYRRKHLEPRKVGLA